MLREREKGGKGGVGGGLIKEDRCQALARKGGGRRAEEEEEEDEWEGDEGR